MPLAGCNRWVAAVVSRTNPTCVLGRDEPVKHVRPAPFGEGDHVDEKVRCLLFCPIAFYFFATALAQDSAGAICGTDTLHARARAATQGDDGEWRPAVIVAALPHDIFEVDGAGGAGLKRHRRRLRWPRYAGGDTVQVRLDAGTWTNAVVVATESRSLVALVHDTVDPKRFPLSHVRPFLRISALDVTSMDPEGTEEPSGGVGADADTRRLKYKVRPPLDFTELPNNCFEVTVDKSNGLGVSLGWTKQQTVVVTAFRLLPNRDWGPLEACELVGLKDQLLAINGQSVGGLSFSQVADLIRSSPNRISLRFGRATVSRVDVALV